MIKLYPYLLFFILAFGCKTSKIEKRLSKDRFHDVIRKHGKKPSKNSAEENFHVAEAYRRSNKIEKAAKYYEAAISGGFEQGISSIFLSKSLKSQKKYDSAVHVLSNYLTSGVDTAYIEQARAELTSLKGIDDLQQKKNYFRLKNLESVNTSGTEYSPVYKKNKLYFVSNRGTSKIYKNLGIPFTNIFEAQSKGAVVEKSTIRALPEVINHFSANEGSMTFSRDGRTMIFAKGNTGKSRDADEVHLFFARFRNDKWTKPKPLDINEAKSWNSCPSLSPNGKSLFFSSNRPGGYGGTDIYMATLNNRGRWVDVRNMGPKINTIGNENFPFLAKDGSFYFSSDGHPGYGKMDVFKETRKGGKVTIQNLGRPVNSEADDFGIFFFDETRGFLTSNRKGGKGDDDIYTFVNDDPNLKIINYWLKGRVVSKTDTSMLQMKQAKVEMQSDQEGEILDEAFTGSKGGFKFRVYEDEDYQLITEKEGFFTNRSAFTTFGKSVDPTKLSKRINNITFEIEINLDPIVIDKAIVLKNIYYDLDKAEIREDAAKELDKLVQVLSDNPEIAIELGSHTDTRADDAYNADLSERRAQSAVDYIIENGIAGERLVAKGYGETQLIIKNAKNEDEHQVNRRTEFKVTEYRSEKNSENKKDNEDQDNVTESFDKYFDSEDEC